MTIDRMRIAELMCAGLRWSAASAASLAVLACARPNELIAMPGGTVELPAAEAPGSWTIDEPLWREIPAQRVRLEPFEIQAHEVTVAEYRRCVEAGACVALDVGDRPLCNSGRATRNQHPINGIDEARARSYCAWLGLRLPTEFEWNWVAQNGEAATSNPWGEAAPSCRVTVARGRAGPGCGLGRTWRVGVKRRDRTTRGVHDLGGNVMELVDTRDGLVALGGDAWTRGGQSSIDPRGSAWRGERKTTSADDRVDAGFRCVSVPD